MTEGHSMTFVSLSKVKEKKIDDVLASFELMLLPRDTMCYNY